ncbi:MAG TPA: 4Fe-4S binding protein, partial [Deltaproteobacteria bacterium]|nr:4Fe-4S binding protein [Deltaproteobacteria bacterium]
MKRMRKIIRIDEEKCDGCGQCILACAEGALALVDGKARLVGEVYCDGIGACIGQCPQGALTVVERQADEFDEEAVKKHLRTAAHGGVHSGSEQEDTLACGCPSSVMTTLNRKQPAASNNRDHEAVSELGHWPVKLQLLGPDAAFLKGADLVLLADCAAAAHPDLHSQVLRDHAVAMGCPKLDNLEAHIIRLSEILERAVPRSLTVVHMEVPCCRAFL